MKNYLPLVAFSIFSILASCNEQMYDSPHRTTFLSNVLSFETDEQFDSVTNKILGMTDQELDNWERKNSFVSYRSVFKNANKEWLEVTTTNEQTNFLKKYQDILTLVDSTLKPLIEIYLYQSIVNREGIYRTNGYVNKIIGDYIVSVKENEFLKLNNIKSIKTDSKNTPTHEDGVKIFKFIDSDSNSNLRISTTCEPTMVAEYFDNHRKCSDDRRVYVSAKSYIKFSTNFEGDWRQPRVEIKVWGTIRNSWCNWGNYLTQLQYRNVSFSIMAWIRQDGISSPLLYTRSLTDYAPLGDRSVLTWDQPIGNPVLNQVIAASAFTSLHAEGSSRGVSSNWAVLDCQ